MSDRRAIAEHLRSVGMDVQQDVPLSKRGFWRIGGPADLFVTATSVAHVRAVMSTAEPITVLGNGSNLLVADAGVRGITLKLAGALRDTRFGQSAAGPWVDAGAGLLNAPLLARLSKRGLAGLACLAGVPGTVGGAVRMNAGTVLGEIGERIVFVDLVLPGGGVQRLPQSELHLTYRRAVMPRGAVLTNARLRLHEDTGGEEAAQIRHHLDRRRRTQPLDQPSCGSVFKNPQGDHAGRLIEAAGLKGHQQGGAQISEVHANFIVNTGGATANDVYTLVRLARDTVRTRFGVTLNPEVHPVGDWPDGTWPLP